MKILIDVNLSFRWADTLMAEGIEAVFWRTLGPGNTPDTEIEHGAIVTIDEHKTRVHILPFSVKD
jgi:predicted nuclease of predicted toxin-antitoxin system